MLSEVRSAEFTLRYEIGPKLIKGTVDIIFEPSLAVNDGVWTRHAGNRPPRRVLRCPDAPQSNAQFGVAWSKRAQTTAPRTIARIIELIRFHDPAQPRAGTYEWRRPVRRPVAGVPTGIHRCPLNAPPPIADSWPSPRRAAAPSPSRPAARSKAWAKTRVCRREHVRSLATRRTDRLVASRRAEVFRARPPDTITPKGSRHAPLGHSVLHHRDHRRHLRLRKHRRRADIAKILFFIFLILFLVSLVLNLVRGKPVA